MHLNNSFVNFRLDGISFLSIFNVSIDYSDILIDFDNGEDEARKTTGPLTFWVISVEVGYPDLHDNRGHLVSW